MRWIKKFGEAWSTNTRDYAANVYHPKSKFWKAIFRPLESAAPPNFLYALENDQFLLAHPLPGTKAFYNFLSKVGHKLA